MKTSKIIFVSFLILILPFQAEFTQVHGLALVPPIDVRKIKYIGFQKCIFKLLGWNEMEPTEPPNFNCSKTGLLMKIVQITNLTNFPNFCAKNEDLFVFLEE